MHDPAAYDGHEAAGAYGNESRTHERMLDAADVAHGDRVLDVGCGTGTLAIAASRRAGRRGTVTAIDASPEMVAFARAKARRDSSSASILRATADGLPFSDGSFDVVLCALALHHVRESARATAIAEMHRVLAREGRLLVVEFGWPIGMRALVRPRLLLRARRAPKLLDEAAALLREAAFRDVTVGPLDVPLLGYARGRR